jgi:hypothetical protein
MIVDPTELDIDVYKDRDYSKTFIIKDSEDALLDISDWTVESQIRPTYSSDSLTAQMVVVIVTADSSITTSLESAVTGVIDASTPIDLNSTTTATNLVWDLLVTTTGGDRFSLITGVCTFHDTVTREVT